MTHQQHQAGQDAQHEKEQTQKGYCIDCESNVLYLKGGDGDLCADCGNPYVERLKEGE